jgi:hypothetical protein
MARPSSTVTSIEHVSGQSWGQTARMTSVGILKLYDCPMRLAAWFLALVPLTLLAGDDLTPLSDEFNDASTLAQWQRVYVVEGWPANQLELQDINTTRPGMMVMMPFTSTWFNDYRGELTFKEVQGDFVVTTDVEANRRNGTGPPRSAYSLAGIMIRTPRQITPATWRPGGENYLFLSLGAASSPGTYQFEVKSTVSSNSQLIVESAGTGRAIIQYARLGPYFIALKSVNGVWTVHHRYFRADMPSTLQVGMTVYTDYPTASSVPPLTHNSTVIRAGNPDLVAAFDYFRFARPRVPPALANANFSTVSDADLLSFLGAAAIQAPQMRHRAVRP